MWVVDADFPQQVIMLCGRAGHVVCAVSAGVGLARGDERMIARVFCGQKRDVIVRSD
jgi:hypothetical protein